MNTTRELTPDEAVQMCHAPSDAFSAGEWCYAANVLAQSWLASERELARLRDGLRRHVEEMEQAAVNWREIAKQERAKGEVAFMCDEGPLPAHVISTARRISFESAASQARALLSASQDADETANAVEAAEPWCAYEGCQEPPVGYDADVDEHYCAKHKGPC